MCYLILTVILIAAWTVSFVTSGYELMSPVSLALLGLCISVMLSIVGLATWNHVALEWEGLAVVSVGSLSLLVGALLVGRLAGGMEFRVFNSFGNAGYRASVWKYLIVVAVLVLAIVLRVFETYQIAEGMGIDSSSYSAAATAVRNGLSSIHTASGIKVGMGFSFLERQLEKISIVSGYVAAFLLVRSMLSRDIGRIVLSGVMLAVPCLFCLASGARTTILYYAVAFVVIYAILALREGRKPKCFAARLFAGCSVLAVIGAVIFYLASSVIGRKAGSGIVEYISFYYGCGTPALQHVIDAGALPQLTPGVRSFYYLFSVPYKLGLIGDYPSYSIAWVDMGGHGCNVFTGFARYYLDFGFAGVVALSLFAAAFMTLVYQAARSTGFPALVVLAGYLGAYAFDFAREEFVFSRLFSPTQFVSVAIMLTLTLFLTTSLREDAIWLRNKAAAFRGGRAA